MATLSDSFDYSAPQSESTRSFDGNGDDGYAGEDNYEQFDSVSGANSDFDSQPPIYGHGGDFVPEENGKRLEADFEGSDGPILPPPSEMEAEEGVALREWRRQNALVLEEKEKREKELMSQIIKEADEFLIEFYRKREISCEKSKETNREKEKLYVANQEKFHAEADKDYWKAIAELVPREVPAMEKKRGKKEQEKQAGITVIQGPKPGKPTELSRMRQILIKLKHNTPPHLKHSPPPPPTENATKDAKTDAAAASLKAAPVTATTEAVAVA